MGRLWSYSTGKKKLNKVRVYERYKGSPIWVEYRSWDGKRIQEPLGKPFKVSIYDKDQAKLIADEISHARRKRQEAATTSELLGKPAPHTVNELLATYHAGKESDWKHHHARTQKTLREFWELAIGKRDITAITPAVAKDIVRSAAKAKEWGSTTTERKYLRYLKDVFNYAQNQLKWITEQYNLSALEMPELDQDSEELTYTAQEAIALLSKAPDVDLRCAAMLEIMWATGRRFEAVRQLKASAVVVEPDGSAWIRFPGLTDKANKKGLAALEARPTAILGRLLATPAVKASGLLFPEGDLESPSKRRPVVPEKDLRDWLDAAEKKAGVADVAGRSYHGMKRTFATVAEDVEAASEQSGTTVQTLRKSYRKQQQERKKKGAKQAESALTNYTKSDNNRDGM